MREITVNVLLLAERIYSTLASDFHTLISVIIGLSHLKNQDQPSQKQSWHQTFKCISWSSMLILNLELQTKICSRLDYAEMPIFFAAK